MHASDGFVPLAVWLRAASAPPPDAAPAATPPLPEAVAPPVAVPPPLGEVLREVRLFRACLADALDAASATLRRELACAVLGRELLLAPADVAALGARLVAEHAAAHPLCVRLAPSDAECVALDVPVVADPRLDPGDCVIELADGEIDARLGTRLAAVLAAWS